MADVPRAAVRPAVSVTGGSACWRRRWRACGLVGAVETGALSRNGETTVEVSLAEVGLERSHGLVGFCFVAPLVAAGGEEAGLFDDRIACSHGAHGRDRVAASC